MSTYLVTTYDDAATYSVVLDETGLVEAEGLSDESTQALAQSVARYMRHGVSPAAALGRAVGPYSFVTESGGSPGVS